MLPPPLTFINNTTQRGFNLVEAAIVLGVIGLIIGGIWTAAASINAKRNLALLEQAILQIHTNIAAQWKGQPWPSTWTNWDAYVTEGKLAPADMICGSGCLSGYFPDSWVSIAGAADVFHVYVFNLKRADCINVFFRIGGTLANADTGFSRIYSYTTSTAYYPPYTLAQASAACTGTNDITFLFDAPF